MSLAISPSVASGEPIPVTGGPNLASRHDSPPQITPGKVSLNGNVSANGPEKTLPTDEALGAYVRFFKLLSDETRFRIVLLLGGNAEFNVRTLCQRLDQSQPAVSHHLALLKEAGVVALRRQGKHNFYRLQATGVAGTLRAVASGLAS